MSKRLYISVVTLLAVMAATSCNRQMIEPDRGTSESVGADGRICFHVSDPVKAAPATDVASFWVTALRNPEKGGEKYIDNLMVDQQSAGVYTTDYYWPKEDLDFFALNFRPSVSAYPATRTLGADDYGYNSIVWTGPDVYFGQLDGTPYGTMKYALAAPVADDVEFKDDAVNQPDYTVALVDDAAGDLNGGVVRLDFKHSLSAVNFKIGEDCMDSLGRQVKEVRISGVPSSGICTFTARDGSVDFDWNVDGVPVETYRQSIPCVGTSTNVNNGSLINPGDLTFMLIPHEISADAEISIVFSLHNEMDPEYHHDLVVEKKIRDLTPEWLPGKRYTYVINNDESVGVSVNDELEAKVKGNLEIRNTGVSVVNVRAYIVGWWEDEDGVMVAPWMKEDGTFTGYGWSDGRNFDGEGSSWKLASDGFFYYKDGLWPGETAPKLFETYTLTNGRTDARLILNVVTQAALHYVAATAWPALAESSVPSAVYNMAGLQPVAQEPVTMNVAMKGLLKDENAVLRIYRWNEDPSATAENQWIHYSDMMLYGPEDAVDAATAAQKSSGKQISVYSGKWKIEETGWAWSYTYAGHSITKILSSSSNQNERTFTFELMKADASSDTYLPSGKYGEAVVQNDFGTGKVTAGASAPASDSSFEIIGENGIRW